ncbi:pseudaminic acid cytidylyltransferase [Herminiimonas sp. KBW02]|uniref:pseudaminic acid cytidylyltransferase n=1 Tax=Herminiimonas sp. KBW02 TaxID=2153363 RepID=UPI000F5B6A3B|nr:pseudaminic acid cytidylyltransferase [Herminiimonas sp. KBW02]RQO36087.1 pseudaminic acid cytidylyltransferase [Herminiimonas sp. KBW02]
MKIAVIPARGGSKRIPRKNIKNFCGKPMIAWSIEAAKKSGVFDHILVSTDDEEIRDIACGLGVQVPFLRPPHLSDDHAGTTEVIGHATQWALDQNWPITAVCCIYAASPFIQGDDIKRGLEILEAGDWSYVFPAADFSAPIFRSFSQQKNGGVEMFFPDLFLTRSQDLPKALHDTGQFYWGRPSAWLEGARIFDKHSFPLLLPRWRVQDIDDQEDWIRAELIAKHILELNNEDGIQ